MGERKSTMNMRVWILRARDQLSIEPNIVDHMKRSGSCKPVHELQWEVGLCVVWWNSITSSISPTMNNWTRQEIENFVETSVWKKLWWNFDELEWCEMWWDQLKKKLVKNSICFFFIINSYFRKKVGLYKKEYKSKAPKYSQQNRVDKALKILFFHNEKTMRKKWIFLFLQEVISWNILEQRISNSNELRAQLLLQLRLHGFQNFMSILFQEQIRGFNCNREKRKCWKTISNGLSLKQQWNFLISPHCCCHLSTHLKFYCCWKF